VTGPVQHRPLSEAWANPYVRVAAYLGAAVIVAWLASSLLPALQPFFVIAVTGFGIAWLFDPAVTRLQRWRIPRFVGTLIVYLFLGMAVVLLVLIVAGLAAQAAQLTRLLPDITGAVEDAVLWVQELVRRFLERDLLRPYLDEILTSLTRALEDLAENLSRALGDIVRQAGAIFLAIVDVAAVAVQVVLGVLAGVYLLYDFPRITANMLRLFPVVAQPTIAQFAGDLNRVVGGYIRGQVAIGVIMFLLSWGGFSILGVPLAFTLALVFGALNFIPYLGNLLTFTPALILTIATTGWLAGAGVLALSAVLGLIESQILVPLIHGRFVNLHPVTILLALAMFASAFGLLGALLAVPAIALIKVLLDRYWLTSRLYKGEQSL